MLNIDILQIKLYKNFSNRNELFFEAEKLLQIKEFALKHGIVMDDVFVLSNDIEDNIIFYKIIAERKNYNQSVKLETTFAKLKDNNKVSNISEGRKSWKIN